MSDETPSNDASKEIAPGDGLKPAVLIAILGLFGVAIWVTLRGGDDEVPPPEPPLEGISQPAESDSL